MAATGAHGEVGSDGQRVSRPGYFGRARASRRALRTIAIGPAAVFGALLSGLVALIWAVLFMAPIGIHLGATGFFATPAMSVVYAWRSLTALALVTLLAAAVGAFVWATGALICKWAVGGFTVIWK